MTAPMTAGEAARTFREDRVAWMNNSAPPTSFQEWLTAWFLKHWPAGGAVTGRALFEAVHAETPTPLRWDSAGTALQAVYNRAAARLSAPPVAFDARALRIALLEEFPTLAEWGARIEESIRRHAAAPSATRVVEVTGEDYAHAQEVEQDARRGGSNGLAAMNAGVVALNDRLRARATTAGQTTGAQWVRRPEGQASALVVPETPCVVWIEWMDGGKSAGMWGDHISVEHVARWSADGITWYERTPATAGEWTAESVAACVGQRRVVSINEGERGHLCDWTAYDAASIAARFNAVQVTAYYILPPTVSDEDVTNADHWKEGETAEYIAKCFNGWGVTRYLVIPPIEVQP